MWVGASATDPPHFPDVNPQAYISDNGGRTWTLLLADVNHVRPPCCKRLLRASCSLTNHAHGASHAPAHSPQCDFGSRRRLAGVQASTIFCGHYSDITDDSDRTVHIVRIARRDTGNSERAGNAGRTERWAYGTLGACLP